MDSKEFTSFMSRLKRLFPSFASYADSMKPEDRVEVGEEWKRGLAKTEFVDAMEALTAIHTGEAKSFNTWEFGTWLAHVRTLAASNRSERTRGTLKGEMPWEEPSRASGDMGGIFRKIIAIQNEGGDVQQAIADLIPITDDGRRYSCWRCQDSGFVNVWHVATMLSISRGEEMKPTKWKTMVTLCNCRNGRSKISPNGKRPTWTEEHVFSETKHCLCKHGDTKSESNRTELREFMATLEQRQLESRGNYSPSLAAYGKDASYAG